MTVARISEKIFGFSYLSLKLSLASPKKGIMLWCSYLRSFIKLTNFSKTGNFIVKFNFISTPWKIKIPPQPHHQPTHPTTTHSTAPPHPTTTYPSHLTLPPPPTYTPILQPPTMGKKWGLNFSRTGNFIKKLNFISTPWKIKIPPQPHPSDLPTSPLPNPPHSTTTHPPHLIPPPPPPYHPLHHPHPPMEKNWGLNA